MPSRLRREEIVTIQVLTEKGETHCQIVRVLGVTEGTARYHLRRAAEGASDGRRDKPFKAEAVAEVWTCPGLVDTSRTLLRSGRRCRMGRPRRQVTWEFKVEAVRLTRESGKPVRQVARELGVRPDLRHEWRRAVAARMPETPARAAASAEEEVRRLRRENEGLRQERDFLNRAAAFFARTSR